MRVNQSTGIGLTTGNDVCTILGKPTHCVKVFKKFPLAINGL